jgi:hypothetical protein
MNAGMRCLIKKFGDVQCFTGEYLKPENAAKWFRYEYNVYTHIKV